VRGPEYDTSDTYWRWAGPRILSYTWLAHRNRRGPRRRRGVGGEISLPSLFQPGTFRSEAAAYIDNRREVVVRYGPLALSGQPMITQHWGPVLIAPGHRVPSRDTWDTWPAFV
jgi:hypothetical protein